MKMLLNMKMGEGRGVAKHLNEFIMVTSQLSLVSINFDYEVRVMVLLSSLLES